MSNDPAPSASPEPTPIPTPTPEANPSFVAQPTVDPAKPADPAPAAPVEYTPLTAEAIKFPEGFTPDQGLMTGFLELANEVKMAPEVAQKLVDFQIKTTQQAEEAATTRWNDVQTDWTNKAKALPDIGGAKLDETLGGISKLVQKYAGSDFTELNQVFTITGAGNHPLMIKFLHNIAKELNEPAPVSGAPARSQQSVAESLYPSMKKGA